LGKLKTLRLLITFYQGFFFPSFLISLGGVATLFVWGMPAFMFVFWYKVLTIFMLYSFVNSYKKKEFFYYQNLGIGRLKLWGFALSADFFLFLALIIFHKKLLFFKLLI